MVEPIIYKFKVTIKSVKMNIERDIFVECCCQPPVTRVKSGFEGVIHRTTDIRASHAEFNQDLEFLSLISLDGRLVLDVREKATLEESSSVGKLSVPISLFFDRGGPTENKSVVQSEEGERITVTYQAEIIPE
mmetsp:Transcript_15399/g.14768  ORF Transcript_15399/g.14768 Transcript_15399/m.14768 type:complete len:133 (-) Transcript_15399:206-604(-)